jgi:hypothetical protein
MATLTCTACGTVLGIPKKGMPKDGLSCNWCGYVNVAAPEEAPKPVTAAAANVPPPLPVAALAEVTTPPPPAEPKAMTHRWADDEDDDGQPYKIPTEAVKTRPCAHCGEKIDLAAKVCVHCGFDAGAGKKVERTFQPIDREWQSGWPRERRIVAFVAFGVVDLLSLSITVAAEGLLPMSIAGILFYVALQAIICGTYESVRIRRNMKGQAEITITWRVGFVPMAPKKVDWRVHEGVGFGHYDATSMFDWMMVLVFLPFGIIGAVLWWYYVIRSDRFFSALTKDHEYPETYMYRGMDEAKAKEITQIATDATGLPLVTKLE